MLENELKCCVSGSFFKFKPEIDGTIDEFQDLGITVLAPAKGWLYIPKHIVQPTDMEFRPLPAEREMSVRQIENEFLISVKKSDFLYIANFEGYVGQSASMEIGFAMAYGVPCFSKEAIKLDEPDDLWLRKTMDDVKIAAPNEIRTLLEAGKKGKATLDPSVLEL